MVRSLDLGQSIRLSCYFVAALWLLRIADMLTPMQLTAWGIYPRSMEGLRGVPLAPLIHGSVEHLFANTPPLAILGSALLYGYPRARWWAILTIWLTAGLGVWLFGRSSLHFGASGLTHGMFFFLFVIGALRRDRRAIGLLMIAFFMYGGMLLTIFPREPGISYESHFFGAAGGVLAAFLLRHRDRPPARKRYSWEGEDQEDEDPIIGDEWRRPERSD